MANEKKDAVVVVERVNTEAVSVVLLGTTPLIMNRMSEKVRQGLLSPRTLTAPEKRSTLKHDPLGEYRGSMYTTTAEETLLGFPASGVKKAMMTAALDLPGARKAQIGRLVYVMGIDLPVYGVPQLFMSVTRSADMSHTPDIRTRAILPQWAMPVMVSYVSPLMNATSIINLLVAAGITAGIGDWRAEKGAGTYGSFEVVKADDSRVVALMESSGRAQQELARDNPICYNDESSDLLAWWAEDAARSGKKTRS